MFSIFFCIKFHRDVQVNRRILHSKQTFQLLNSQILLQPSKVFLAVSQKCWGKIFIHVWMCTHACAIRAYNNWKWFKDQVGIQQVINTRIICNLNSSPILYGLWCHFFLLGCILFFQRIAVIQPMGSPYSLYLTSYKEYSKHPWKNV